MDSSLLALLVISLMLILVLVGVTHLSKPKLNKAHFQKKWEEIVALDASILAVIKADSLLDEALRHAGVKGGTMGERLNNSLGFLRDVNGTWSAHKLRNKLVHETDNAGSKTDCARALRQFKKALKDLGAL